MSTPTGCNQHKHAPGCGHPGATGGPAEVSLTLEAVPALAPDAFVCAGITREGNPCLNFVDESGAECGLCTGTDADVFGNPLGRGGFPRNGNGSAVVTDPEGNVYASGKKKGQVKMLPYKSASSIVVSTSTEGLSVWQQQQLLRALARDPELAARFNAAMAEVDPDDEDAEKAVLNAFRNEAHEIAETQLAAQRGTFSHWLTECADEGVSPIEGLAKGEALGIDADTARRIAEDWVEINDRYGFAPVAVEAKIVNDDLRAAGTTDRVVALTKPLVFTHKGEQVTIPVGTRMIGDLKTGKLRTDRTGSPNYWQKYAGQLAAYAGGVPYDPRAGRRLSWDDMGGQPSQKWGVIIHGDLEKMAAGDRGGFSVFVVDLEEGRRLASASNDLRAAEKSANTSISAA